MAAYLAKLEHDGKNTRRARSFANSAILPALGGVKLRDLDRETLSGGSPTWRAVPRKTCTGRLMTPPKTEEEIRRRQGGANRTWTVLRAALNFAFDDGRIHSDAAWKRIKTLEERRRRPRALVVA